MTDKIKTCVYAISLNEIDHVDQFMESSKEADLILVCDTGSTDGTAERLEQLGAIVYKISQKPWRFDIPRNTALSLIPSDIDMCLSIDLDERLQPGWSTVLDKVWKESNKSITRVSYNYIWDWKQDGSPNTQFYADKIHSRFGYQWKHPCHETLYWVGSRAEVKIQVSEIMLHHRADKTKSRSQYLHLLRLAVSEDPNNDRMRHYYARELMFTLQFDDAITEFKNHLNLPSATWREERAASLRYIARCLRSQNKIAESIEWAIKATTECPNSREPWLELARSAQIAQDWKTCFWAATKCLSIEDKILTYMTDSAAWGSEPYDHAALAAFYLNFRDLALAYGKKAVELSPTDPRLLKNLLFYSSEIK